MTTLKGMTDEEISDFYHQLKNYAKEYSNMHKINNILVIGIGHFGNMVVKKIVKQDNVSKLYIDINKQLLEKFADKPNINLGENCLSVQRYLWKKIDDYKEIYDEISKYQIYFTNYDYIVICVAVFNEDLAFITEVVADFCKHQNKRFMICYTKNNDSDYSKDSAGSKKQYHEVAKEFIKKINGKKYILNEIHGVKTSFLYDNINFKFKGKNYKTELLTQFECVSYDEVNTDIFAKIVGNNIIKLFEGETDE